MAKRVTVLMGGRSAERDVSLTSGEECAAALRDAGYEVRKLDPNIPVAELVADLSGENRPDVVFNALHGRYGEDGSIQGLLDLLQLPYTHSGVLASALAMHKPMAKKLLAADGIEVPEGRLVTRAMLAEGDPMPRPYVLKPYNEGSSVAVYIIAEGDNRLASVVADWPFGDAALVEEYIPGRELTVAVMDGEALAVTEIEARFGFYDYEAKYTEAKAAVHVVPADVPREIYANAMRLAERAHVALGCRGVSRADFRYDDTAGAPGRLVMLEVNTQPGMTPMSLVPEQAAHRGMDFASLCSWMVERAACDG